MKIYTEKQIRNNITLNKEVIEAVADGFSELEAGATDMPPIMRVDIPDYNGEVDVKTAYVRGKDVFAIKVSSGFFDNYKWGLPSGNGLMVLMNTKTGVPESLLLDNGYLTDVRTAAAGAIASHYLAPSFTKTVGVIGAGTQARFQMKALKQVRDFDRCLVFARTQERLESFTEEMETALGVEVVIAGSVEQVVRESDTVVTTTPAKEPVIQPDWLHPGLHITAMGSDAEEKNELDPRILEKVDGLFCDKKTQCFRLGELHHGLTQGTITEDADITELGALTSGKRVGRRDDQQITVCDLTGTGVQDTAIASYTFHRLSKEGVGTVIQNT